MTVIAWDGKALAADRLCTTDDTTLSTGRKIFEIPGGAIAACGEISSCASVIKWYRDGQIPGHWPACQANDDRWAILIVADKEGCRYYTRQPIAIEVLDPIAAWGIGREAALGAMEMGADAVRAVEVASKWVAGCGRGVDSILVKTS